jgi:hypothetical protein
MTRVSNNTGHARGVFWPYPVVRTNFWRWGDQKPGPDKKIGFGADICPGMKDLYIRGSYVEIETRTLKFPNW